MGDEDHRRFDLAVDAHQLRPHLPPQRGIEAGERLVEQEEAGPPHERLGDRHALPLPAGELVDAAIEERARYRARWRLPRVRSAITCFDTPPRLQREADVVAHVEVRIERDRLEDHRDVPLLRRNIVHRPLAEVELTAGRLLEPGQHVQRRRLAAAGRAEQHQQLAVLDLEVEIADGGEPALELLADVDKADGVCRSRVRSRSLGLQSRSMFATVPRRHRFYEPRHLPRYNGSTRFRLRMRLWKR